MISLDIQNAFNSIHKNSILSILDVYNVLNKLKLLIKDYLRNRKIIISDTEMMDFNIGVPQGSSLGPTLWLLIAKDLLIRNKGILYNKK